MSSSSELKPKFKFYLICFVFEKIHPSFTAFLIVSLAQTLTHARTHSLTHSLTHSRTHALFLSLTHTLTHSLTHRTSLTHWHLRSVEVWLNGTTWSSARCETLAATEVFNSLTFSLIDRLTLALTYPLTHSLAHSLTLLSPFCCNLA